MKNLLVLLTSLNLFFTSINANAENIVFKYLLNTPLTLMDAGVLKVQNKLNEINLKLHRSYRSGITGSVSALGDYIVITVIEDRSLNSSNLPEADTFITCEQLLTYTEYHLGMCFTKDEHNTSVFDPSECDNEFKNHFLSSAMNRYFNHYGYEVAGRPVKLGEMLSEFVVVEAGILASSDNKKFCHRISAGDIEEGYWSLEYAINAQKNQQK